MCYLPVCGSQQITTEEVGKNQTWTPSPVLVCVLRFHILLMMSSGGSGRDQFRGKAFPNSSLYRIYAVIALMIKQDRFFISAGIFQIIPFFLQAFCCIPLWRPSSGMSSGRILFVEIAVCSKPPPRKGVPPLLCFSAGPLCSYSPFC